MQGVALAEAEQRAAAAKDAAEREASGARAAQAQAEELKGQLAAAKEELASQVRICMRLSQCGQLQLHFLSSGVLW